MHPDTVTTMNYLARLYNGQGKIRKAEPLYERCYEICGRVLGLEHPNTLASMNNLAGSHPLQADFATAELLHERCYEIHSRRFGSEHSDALTSMNSLASLYRALRQNSCLNVVTASAAGYWDRSIPTPLLL
jgi:hypothetical protein